MRVNVEGIVDHMSSEVRKALRDAVIEVIGPEVYFDDRALFRAFRRAVGRKCNLWEIVPDRLVEKG